MLHALLTHPRPAVASVALNRFAAAFRRAPVSNTPCPELDREEFGRLLLQTAAEETNLPPAEFEPIAAGDDPDELRRQMTEAVWQSLLYDPRG